MENSKNISSPGDIMKKIIKIKIGLEDTKIWWNKKYIKDKEKVIKTAISHLERLLKVI